MNLCFTVHKLTKERKKLWSNLFDSESVAGMTLLVFQEEDTKHGVSHLQGYMELSKFYRYAALIKLCGGDVWFAGRLGTKSQALHYVKKPVKGCGCRHCKGPGVYNGGMRFVSK